jgi:hypothetical protein
MSIYSSEYNNGELWLRTLDGKIEASNKILSAVYAKYENVNPTFFSELNTNNIQKFDIFYDVIHVATETGFIFEKIKVNKDGNIVPFQNNSSFNKIAQVPIDYWFDEINFKIYFVELRSGIQQIKTPDSEAAFDFYISMTEYDCKNGNSSLLLKNHITIPLLSVRSWKADKANIEKPKICYNKDTKQFNVSFVFRNYDYKLALMSLNIINKGVFSIESINALIPFVNGFGQYTITNLL